VTGPEHYREAEKRMEASDWQRQEAEDDTWLMTALHEAAIAQVHATLALAAATATTLIMAADADSDYDIPGAGTTKQVAAWKQVTR
jgi:hypothetical protein